MHMAASLAGCRMALLSTGWTSYYLFGIIGHKKHSFPAVFSLAGGAFAGWRVLTITSLLMSVFGQGCEPHLRKLWLKFPVLAQNRSGNIASLAVGQHQKQPPQWRI